MGIIDQTKCPVKTGSIYPEPYATEMKGRSSLCLGDADGLTQFGANLVIFGPGAKSSLHHWHKVEDEFVMLTEGDTVMRPGDCAEFPAGDTKGHHFINQTDQMAKFLVVGKRSKHEVATYSDADMMVKLKDGKAASTYRDGTMWEGPW